MIVACPECTAVYEDAYRSTLCPHNTFASNDGRNNFAHHPASYLHQSGCRCSTCISARLIGRAKRARA